MNTEKHLHIVRLEANNILRLKAVNISTDGRPVVIVSGENGAGKTSVLNSIAYALGGKDMIDAVPIRTGASKAKVTVDLGEFKVTRSFSALGGSTLTIEDNTGALVRSPQTLLDKLTNRIAFDPLAFTRMKSGEQLETLRKLVGLDFTTLDSKRKTAYDERTIANRELASAKARAAECEVDPETPDEEVSVANLTSEIAKIQEHNKRNNVHRDEAKRREVRLDSALASRKEIVRQVEKLKAELDEKLGELKGCDNSIVERTKEFQEYDKAALELIDQDDSPIRQKINEAGTINAKVRDKKNYTKLQAEVAAREKSANLLTEEIEAFDQEKSDQLSKAKFPLEGLSFDDTGVLLNGLPFTQGSQALQLRSAVAIGIAMNPTIRVMLVRDAAVLDDKSMALVAKMAEENDCQFWLEVLKSDDKSAVIIEDGMVKEEVASE